ncbi:hypothetical protein BKA67DRAFT_559012 [Truncatella angustata]|uniref:Uncharacterized protein n=1 Tax=Truncatella angustata TaxID=152316 RepID=A0A9P8ZZE9_9PEZI|nr:uncharacterized protein BKA67DRAFT_559012 [Truncatella angustata]KAH6654939.1 hypothetical protein BKA67DRAFT_559012 [Truncatella angustata]
MSLSASGDPRGWLSTDPFCWVLIVHPSRTKGQADLDPRTMAKNSQAIIVTICIINTGEIPCPCPCPVSGTRIPVSKEQLYEPT